MADVIFMMLGDFGFWARVLVSCTIWYTLACIISRCHSKCDERQIWSTKAAPWLALLFTAPLSGIGAWLWWDDILMAILLGFTTLILPMLFLAILSGMEPWITGYQPVDMYTKPGRFNTSA